MTGGSEGKSPSQKDSIFFSPLPGPASTPQPPPPDLCFSHPSAWPQQTTAPSWAVCHPLVPAQRFNLLWVTGTPAQDPSFSGCRAWLAARTPIRLSGGGRRWALRPSSVPCWISGSSSLPPRLSCPKPTQSHGAAPSRLPPHCPAGSENVTSPARVAATACCATLE